MWDPREPSAQRARQATTTRGFEQCHQWARQLSRPAAAKAVWPPLSSDRTVMRDAASVRAPLIIGELGSARDPLCVPPKAQPPHALSTCYRTKRRVTFAESDRSRWLLTWPSLLMIMTRSSRTPRQWDAVQAMNSRETGDGATVTTDKRTKRGAPGTLITVPVETKPRLRGPTPIGADRS